MIPLLGGMPSAIPALAACVSLLLLAAALLGASRGRSTAAGVASGASPVDRDDLLAMLLEARANDGADRLWATDASLRLREGLDAMPGGVLLTDLFGEGPGLETLRAATRAREPFHDIVVPALSSGDIAVWWRIAGQPSFDRDGAFVGYRGLMADITELRRAQARIAHLATHDALTGLANREMLQVECVRACAAAASGGPGVALLALDLDGFKRVNDSLGHAAGDALLAAVAATLRDLAPREALVARLGGDEFAILCPPTEVETLARAIVRAIARPFVLGETTALIGISIGIALAPAHAKEPGDLARKADLALYRAKEAGRGRHVVFVEAFAEEREERRRLEADIRAALERDEFTLHYQPLLDLAAGHVGGCEALIRWRSPTRGDVPPSAFIPVAESTGLVLPIGRFVLARACRDAAAWPRPVSVAVNISPRHLSSATFRSDVVDALQASGLPASRLEIEITEGVFVERSKASLDALTWLRERGIKVALDDFGTGFSSLNYLIDFPVDKIKIDRTFVAGLVESHQNRAVVDAILFLARKLGLRVVAEGVETAEQALALKLRRCDDLQGYLICRPRPAEDIGRLILDMPADLRTRVPALLESSLAAALVMKRATA